MAERLPSPVVNHSYSGLEKHSCPRAAPEDAGLPAMEYTRLLPSPVLTFRSAQKSDTGWFLAPQTVSL